MVVTEVGGRCVGERTFMVGLVIVSEDDDIHSPRETETDTDGDELETCLSEHEDTCCRRISKGKNDEHVRHCSDGPPYIK